MSHTFEHTGYQQLHGCMHNVLTTKTAWPLLPCCWGYSLGLFKVVSSCFDWISLSEQFPSATATAEHSTKPPSGDGMTCFEGLHRWIVIIMDDLTMMYPLVNSNSFEKSPFPIGKSTINGPFSRAT